MDLFSADGLPNLLPYNGTVNYYGIIFNEKESSFFYEKLVQNIEWKNDEAVIYGKPFITDRKVAWYGNKDYDYTYSNNTKKALPWTKELLELKSKIENITNSTYNSCLLNLYHNGNEGMAWHSDDEKMLKENAAIASLSFGAERMFYFKHKKTAQKVGMILQNGSLLVMKDETQKHWLHRLPPTKKVTRPRINLTFRTMEI